MSLKNAQASNWVAESAEATATAFVLKGSSKSYTSFSRAFLAGDTVFYSAHDEQGNREAGYGVFNGSTEITRNPTATLVSRAYNSNSPSKVSFTGEITVACTFNASAFNTLWKALDAIDPDGDGSINIPPELIDGLIDNLNSKAEQADLEKEIQDRIDGDKALQDQIDALDPDGDRKVDWSEIEGKPTEFPPSAHQQGWDTITGKPAEYPPSSHGHAWGEITGKPTEFPPSAHNHDGEYLKAETDPTVPDHVKAITTTDIDNWNASGAGASSWDDLTGKPTEFPPAAHNQGWDTITGAPSEYPPESHTHEQSEVDGLELRLDAIEGSIGSGGGFVDAPNDAKLYGRQSEAWAEVVIPGGGASSWDELADKPTEFPPSAHGHAWGEITGKPGTFPPESHNHVVADITDFDPADYQPAGEYVGEAPEDGKQYARKDAGWSEITSTGGGSSLWEQNGNDIYYDAGNVGIGMTPAVRTAKEQLAEWKTKAKKSSWTEATDGAFEVLPTEEALAEWMETRAAGDKLQVAGNISATGAVTAGEVFTFDIGRDVANCGLRFASLSGTPTIRPIDMGASPVDISNGQISLGDINSKFKDAHFSGAVSAGEMNIYTNRIWRTGFSGLQFTDSVRPVGSDGVQTDGELSIGTLDQRFQYGYFSANVTAKDYIVGQNIYRSASGAGGLKLTTLASIIPTDNTGTNSDGELTLGSGANRFKDAHFSGTVNAGAFVGDGSGLTGVGGGSGGLPDGGYTYGWSITATDFIATSDERVKDNITTAPVGLIDSLKGREWDWKESGEKGSGVVAQELEQVLPHLVHTDDEGMKSVSYMGLCAYLIEELKDCRQRIADLEAKS